MAGGPNDPGTATIGIGPDNTLQERMADAFFDTLTPTALAAQANDYCPTGIRTANALRLTATGAQTITGIADLSEDYTPTATTPGDGRLLLIVNADDTDTITLAHASSSSTAGYKFYAPAAQDYKLGPGASVEVMYDATSPGYWRILAGDKDILTHEAATDPHAVYVLESLYDAKGDLISASADNTPSLVTVGANDTILMADSTATAGLKWVASASPTGAETFGCAAATGTADTFTRGDHVHALPYVIDVPGLFSVSGDIAATIAAGTDNWAPTGLSGASVIRVTATGAQSITGLTGGADGRVILLCNVGSANVTLTHNATSTEANRFYGPADQNYVLVPDEACFLLYDSTTSRWRVIAQADIPKSLIAAAGDLIHGSGSGTAAKLTVGTDDYILMADSTVSGVGLKWAAPGTTPSTQAMGDTAAAGTTDGYERAGHKHAMPAITDSVSTSSSTTVASATAAKAAYDGIATHAGLDLASAVHGFKGIVKALVDGKTEVIAENEVNGWSISAGTSGGGATATLTYNAHAGSALAFPTSYVTISAADVKTNLLTISDFTGKDADIAVTASGAGPRVFEITFSGTLGATDIGAISVAYAGDGAGDAAFTETNKGVVATTYTVTGLASGDSLAPVIQYATKAAIATQTLRATTDYTITADTLTVIANPVDENGNQLLVEYVDLT